MSCGVSPYGFKTMTVSTSHKSPVKGDFALAMSGSEQLHIGSPHVAGVVQKWVGSDIISIFQ